MSTLVPGCGLLGYEVPTDVEGAMAIQGILLKDAAQICMACMDLRSSGLTPTCHPILMENDPSLPPPFFVLVQAQQPIPQQVS
jgi:hypothetical protein